MSADWVGAQFGVTLHGEHGEPLTDLVQLALRRNPRRAHLLVSTVLGKHVPVDPRIVHDAGLRLGRAVAARLDGTPALVLGYAETATGLGHCVAEALDAHYLHSTRRQVDAVAPRAAFEEQHSHASAHLLSPEDPALLARPGTLVLVDDEFSTGATALNTITELQRLCTRSRYLIAALVDLRSPEHRHRTADAAKQLGTTIDVVALATGSVSCPDEFPERAAQLVAQHLPDEPQAQPRAEVIDVPAVWRARESGRHGFSPDDHCAARKAAREQAALIQTAGPNVLVLGTEELMYAPLLIALELAQRPELHVRFSSTTRSPVVAVDEPGYPIRSALTFPAHDAEGNRYAYNVARGFDDIVVVIDAAAADGLVDALRAVCARVHVVRLPSYRPVLPDPLRGPTFGSYRPDEVAWLLTDLSHVPLEAPIEEREEAVQSGGAHYAESLPVEYRPSAEYQALFAAALTESAGRIAHAVGVLTELVLGERGDEVVLVSLARAGTPIGILMRRWAKFARGLDLPHYAASIVRGRGIDVTALRYLAAAHDPSRVQFVDGWTGKGAIVRELRAAVELCDPRFSPELAVLADTGSCTRLYGTRQDFLVPSACLNATVSGLISRTVLNDTVLAPGQFHGAKFYRDLAPADLSGQFLDAVTAQFAAVAEGVAHDWPVLRRADRTATWAGWSAVEALCERYGIDDVNLIKPGVGETTRVLLRRVPWRVLIRPDAEGELRHVLLLAAQRGVAVETVADLPYSCVGLIHPQFTRGATGADGLRAG